MEIKNTKMVKNCADVYLEKTVAVNSMESKDSGLCRCIFRKDSVHADIIGYVPEEGAEYEAYLSESEAF